MRLLVMEMIIVGLWLAGCQGPPGSAQVDHRDAPRATEPAERQAVLTIDGMACPFCVYGIQRQLERVEGVERADVSLKKGEAYVTFSQQNPPTAEQLRKAVESAGFTPTKVRMP